MYRLVQLFYFEMKRQLAHTVITEGVGKMLKNIYKTLARNNGKKK
jgi:hypothetical protein